MDITKLFVVCNGLEFFGVERVCVDKEVCKCCGCGGRWKITERTTENDSQFRVNKILGSLSLAF